jgi:hypothetical protein
MSTRTVNLRLKPNSVAELTQTLAQGAPGYKQVFKALAVIGLFGMLAVPVVQAQSGTLVANIPFQFNVGKAVLPSGEYRVTPAIPPTYVIQSSTVGRQAAVTITMKVSSSKEEDKGKLVFNQYGNQYFLSKVWRAGSSEGRQLPKSRAETEIAKSISSPEATTVAVKIP